MESAWNALSCLFYDPKAQASSEITCRSACKWQKRLLMFFFIQTYVIDSMHQAGSLQACTYRTKVTMKDVSYSNLSSSQGGLERMCNKQHIQGPSLFFPFFFLFNSSKQKKKVSSQQTLLLSETVQNKIAALYKDPFIKPCLLSSKTVKSMTNRCFFNYLFLHFPNVLESRIRDGHPITKNMGPLKPFISKRQLMLQTMLQCHDKIQSWGGLGVWLKASAGSTGSWRVEVLISRGPLHSSRFLSN